eukprot:1157322-Pelagomonas_calceolata.AAC.5
MANLLPPLLSVPALLMLGVRCSCRSRVRQIDFKGATCASAWICVSFDPNSSCQLRVCVERLSMQALPSVSCPCKYGLALTSLIKMEDTHTRTHTGPCMDQHLRHATPQHRGHGGVSRGPAGGIWPPAACCPPAACLCPPSTSTPCTASCVSEAQRPSHSRTAAAAVAVAAAIAAAASPRGKCVGPQDGWRAGRSNRIMRIRRCVWWGICMQEASALKPHGSVPP